MKNLFSLIFITLCIHVGLAQTTKIINHVPQTKNETAYKYGMFYFVQDKISTPNITLESADAKFIENYLLNSTLELKTPGGGLKLIYEKESIGARHYTFQQTFNNIPVYSSIIKASVSKYNKLISVMNSCLNLASINDQQIQTQIAVLNQTGFVNEFIHSTYSGTPGYQNEITICFTDANTAIAVQRIEVSNPSVGLHELNLIDATGKLIYQKDLNCYNHTTPQDTVINAKVFNPDPLTTSNTVYGSPFVDNNDADDRLLNAQRRNVTVIATFDNGMFTLENSFAKVVNFEAPNTSVVTQAIPDFYYPRSEPGFEDINSFYHITVMQNYIQSLGFTNIMNQQIEIDAHGVNGADNSYFSGGTIPQISFGEGGVDDNEDADVIVHEYGHAMSWSANNNNFNSNDRGGLDEGFGDYQAATYSRAIDPFNWQNIFSWDGFNPFWPGRPGNSTKHYPQGLTGESHDDGEIWCAVMMEIWELIGKTTTDQIMYESLYSWTDNMTMPNAAQLVILADSTLNGGANYTFLCDRFVARGLYTGNCVVPQAVNEIDGTNADIKILNSSGFSNSTGNLIVLFSVTQKIIEVTVNDMAGRNLNSYSFKNTNRVEISPMDLPTGIFTLSIKTTNGIYSVKATRVK